MRRGSVCWYDPAPTVGREQQKRRPWVCIGPASLSKYGLLMVCPLTTKDTPLTDPRIADWCVPFGPDQVLGDPLEASVVLVHHVRTIAAQRVKPEDWTRSRLRMDVIAAVSLVLHDMSSIG